MKENNNIDELFRSGLEGQRIAPSEKSWNNLEAALSKKQSDRRKNKRNRFLIFSMLLLLLTYPAYKFFNRDNAETQNNPGQRRSEINSPEKNSVQPSARNEVIVTEQLEVEKSHSQSNDSKSVEVPVSEKTQSAKPVASVHEVHTIPEPAKEVKVNRLAVNVSKAVSTAIIPTDISKKETTENIAVKEDAVKEKLAVITPEESKHVEEVVVIGQDNLPDEKINSQDIVPVISEQPGDSKAEIGVSTGIIAKTESSKEVPVDTKEDNSETPAIVQSAASTGRNEIDNNANVESKEKIEDENKANENIRANNDSSKVNNDYIPAVNDETKKPLLKRILSNITIGAYYSPDYVKNKFKINEDYTGNASQDESDYDDINAAFSYSTGAIIRYDIGSRWSIGSGITYSTFSQTAVYNTINVVADSVYREVHGRPGGGGHGGGGGGPGGGSGGGPGGGPGGGHHGNNPHNPPSGGNGNHFVVNTPCGAIDLYNVPPHHHTGNSQNGDMLNIKTETSESIHYLNIPLTVRYKFGNGKWSTFVEAGATLNLVNSNKVRITVNDAYTEENEHDGLKKLSYSLILGGGVQYNFYKGLNLFLNPSFRYSITPINQYNPMDSYPYFIGVGAGMSIHF